MPKTPPRDIKIGDTIAGRYEVRGAVGRGGMGRIYRVFDRILGEELALKTLLPDHVEDKVILERFFNEARIARSLSHPNVIRVHDIGQSDGTVYIPMELLKGKSLRQMLDQLQPGQRLPIAGILRMFDALCAALDYAHHFTVHRDIKPENVMILTDGSVKLMDFGISKLKSNPNLTSASIVMGTPHYMAPEQLRNTAAVDARADIYSVGVMLYEVITGDRPTGLAKPASKLRGEVPPALDPIIEMCCQPDPGKRYQTAGELRNALRKVRVEIEQKSSSGERISSSASSGAQSRGGSLRYLLAGIAVAAILGAAISGLRLAEERRHRLIAAAPTGLATVQLPSSGDPAAREFAILSERIEQLRAAAEDAKLEYSEDQQTYVVDEILANGAELWSAAEAMSETNMSGAVELGWDAAACFLAVTRWPARMMFVAPPPPGEARAPAFFIDANPVTIGEFEGFATAQNWEWPAAAAQSPVDAPMTGLAYFDAVAYLSSALPRRRLPSAADVERALDQAIARGTAVSEFVTGDEALNGDNEDGADENVRATRIAMDAFVIPDESYGFDTWFEWTSSIVDRSSTDTPMFGDEVVTVGARWPRGGNVVVAPRRSLRLERSDPGTGFRGKLPMPQSLAELDRFESGAL
jgi:hypothetical protein